MANELIVTNAAALAALVDKTTGDSLTAAEYTTVKDALQEANTATRTANTVFAGPTTGAATAPTFRALVADDMAALRTFVRTPYTATNLGGGFYSALLFRITLGTTDAVAANVVAAVKITEATDSGALYYEAPLVLQRDPANGMSGSLPSGLVRSSYVGSAGTSVPLATGQFAIVAPNGDLTLLVQVSGFVAPTVSMSAVLHCPGDATVTLLV